MRALAEFDPYWIEEPTSPDDVLGHAAIRAAIAPVKVATGEHVQNRIVFKQLLQAGAIDVLQIDAARVGGVNENLAILLLAAKFGVPVCPHAGGVGLCELVQHLSMFDYVAVSGTTEDRVIEYVDHLHEHFLDPVVIREGHYMAPTSPGFSATMRPESIAEFTFPGGTFWAADLDRRRAGGMSDFEGLKALVTGGASGIGRATAELLAERGASGRRPRPGPHERREAAARLPADVTDDDLRTPGRRRRGRRPRRPRRAVNNAGIGAQGTVEDNDDEEWHRVLDVNVVGMVRVARAALPHLRKSPHAAIVNTCSIAATAGLPQRALYSASQGRRVSLTLAMAADHVREGIRVNCVNPGTGDTPWVGRLLDAATDPAAERAALEARQPTGRLVSASEVAGAVAYLASPLSGATTGTALAVDGGMQGLRLRPVGQ
jgi:2-keto-3-deoxy-L-fuconate dehydrogenase